MEGRERHFQSHADPEEKKQEHCVRKDAKELKRLQVLAQRAKANVKKDKLFVFCPGDLDYSDETCKTFSRAFEG